MRIRRGGELVHGELEIMRVEPYDLDSGVRSPHRHCDRPVARRRPSVDGRWSTADGRRPTVVTVTRAAPASKAPLVLGSRVPARWRRDRPQRVKVKWSNSGAIAHGARLERDRRAAALGIDPRTLPAGAVPAGTRSIDALLAWSHNGGLLPDGTLPVFTSRSRAHKQHGRAADAVIAAIDYLTPLPGTVLPGGSVANVALDISDKNSTTYRVLARFGFHTDQRRQQIGHVGAHVPMRVDRADQTRMTLDSGRLPLQ